MLIAVNLSLKHGNNTTLFESEMRPVNWSASDRALRQMAVRPQHVVWVQPKQLAVLLLTGLALPLPEFRNISRYFPIIVERALDLKMRRPTGRNAGRSMLHPNALIVWHTNLVKVMTQPADKTADTFAVGSQQCAEFGRFVRRFFMSLINPLVLAPRAKRLSLPDDIDGFPEIALEGQRRLAMIDLNNQCGANTGHQRFQGILAVFL